MDENVVDILPDLLGVNPPKALIFSFDIARLTSSHGAYYAAPVDGAILQGMRDAAESPSLRASDFIVWCGDDLRDRLVTKYCVAVLLQHSAMAARAVFLPRFQAIDGFLGCTIEPLAPLRLAPRYRYLGGTLWEYGSEDEAGQVRKRDGGIEVRIRVAVDEDILQAVLASLLNDRGSHCSWPEQW